MKMVETARSIYPRDNRGACGSRDGGRDEDIGVRGIKIFRCGQRADN